MPSVTVETATVFRGAGRRFFTRKAAERSLAKAAIKRRCECDRGDKTYRGAPPYVCHYHAMEPDKFARFTQLYVAMFVRPAAHTKDPQPLEAEDKLERAVG